MSETVGRHAVALASVVELATFSARNMIAAKPSATKKPTQMSSTLRVIIPQAPLNMNAVSTKSSARIASDEVTTVRVVARDTPSAVGAAS